MRFLRNRSGFEDVREHLDACKARFTPPLDMRVAIPDYAAKLVARAERFEAWAGQGLIGLVAVYCDDPTRKRAFVTSVSVAADWTRRGLACRLLDDAIAHCRSLGFGRLALSVHSEATALALYRTLGFEARTQAGETLHLSPDLLEETEPHAMRDPDPAMRVRPVAHVTAAGKTS